MKHAKSFTNVLWLGVCAIGWSGATAQTALEEHPRATVRVNVVDELYKRLKIPREAFKTDKCYTRGGGGMGAHIPTCDFYKEIVNLRVNSWSNVVVGDPQISKLPIEFSTGSATRRNCGGIQQEFPFKVSIKTTEGSRVVTSQELVGVERSSHPIPIDPSFISKLAGIAAGDLSKLSLSTQNDESKPNGRTDRSEKADERFKETLLEESRVETVPAYTLTVFKYGDQRTLARMLVTGKVILEGDIQEKPYMVGTKRGGPAATIVNRLADFDVSHRTFEVTGDVAIIGSDRAIHSTVLSRPLDPKNLTDCPLPDPVR